MDFVTPLITLVSCLVDYVLRALTAAGDLDRKIQLLETGLEELIEVRDDLRKQVDRAESLGLTLTSQVKGWLERVDRVQAEVESIRDDLAHKRLCCLSRCRLYGKVEENLNLVDDLKEKGKLEVVLPDGLLLVPVVEIPSRPAVGLGPMLDKVRQLLADEDVGTVGIYGTGGSGKTTLLKCVNNELFSRTHGFDFVIWVGAVSRDIVIEKIQQAIGARLGLSWDDDNQLFVEVRALRIHSIMRRKKFLLLLDDVWGGFDLEKVGIPVPDRANGSKVMFTTRSAEVCAQMDADRTLRMEFLGEDESWKLFYQKVGDVATLDSPKIRSHAKDIVRKCGGLPLALVSMGRAMANKRTEEEWRYAVDVLRETPSEIRGMEDIFALLKFSYDKLDSDTLRSCLLYCSLFPEDFSIEKEQLVEYWAGEGFLDGGPGSGSSKPRIMGYSIIGTLKNTCFLETDEDNDSRIKMHDVVRSFALWVVSGAGKRFVARAGQGLVEAPVADSWECAERISLVDNEITELCGTPVCPHLSTLLLQWNKGLTRISNGFFEHMPALKVVDLSFTSIKDLPTSICKLIGIRHLDLSGTKLSQLPSELGSLTSLTHLNVQRNQYLSTIPRDALSGLHQLKALNLYYGYSRWETRDARGSEIRLLDLEGLRKLESLGITVVHLSTLDKVRRSEYIRKCIQYLYIKECEGLHYLPVSSYPGDGDCLRRLSINNCMDLKHLSVHEAAGSGWLPNLEILALNGLPRLTSIWGDRVGITQGCLLNLRCVNIWYCHKLKSISWILRLPKLETVYVFYCREMEEVVSEEDVTEGDYSNVFRSLRVLSIRDVPVLRSICPKAMFFPCLKKIAVIDCPNLRKLPVRAQNASELPTVYCYREWWENLVWDNAETKRVLLPYFMEA
ncbi:Disease resistance protein RPS2 [Striga hermonthica]|uniref:Disease resistance protein RPS2 n=1 Tax=Striga hermonthica TaxID=68872 RepID=A0A9N7R4P5_STRHE|nr:Disease resistance protein RPS2 [Striga hermonthica]